MIALASGAQAKVLVYEGFDATDYSLETDSCETISDRSLANQTAAIGTSTANWGAMSGSQIKVFGTGYGLDFPQNMKEVGFTARGGSIGLNWKENNASQLRAMYHALGTDVLKVSSASSTSASSSPFSRIARIGFIRMTRLRRATGRTMALALRPFRRTTTTTFS
ncbi:MAG: hypothetical protein ACI4QF_04425 [Kiritimatiellia bacterium]